MLDVQRRSNAESTCQAYIQAVRDALYLLAVVIVVGGACGLLGFMFHATPYLAWTYKELIRDPAVKEAWIYTTNWTQFGTTTILDMTVWPFLPLVASLYVGLSARRIAIVLVVPCPSDAPEHASRPQLWLKTPPPKKKRAKFSRRAVPIPSAPPPLPLTCASRKRRSSYQMLSPYAVALSIRCQRSGGLPKC